MMNQMPQRMDADLQSDQHLNEHHQTQLTKQLSVHHLCDHRCSVQHLFGNAYSCESSGQVHICDANCTQRVYNDRYSTVCRVSRRVFQDPFVQPLPCRKRSCSIGEEPAPDACCKRGPGAPASCPDVSAFHAAGGPSQEDAMVM